jgi:hypothetical protein
MPLLVTEFENIADTDHSEDSPDFSIVSPIPFAAIDMREPIPTVQDGLQTSRF